ncbi:MAG: diaminopimelate epimerase [Fulvivirga sp.]
MTTVPFYKYQATGNDFILIDNRDGIVKASIELAQKLCDRKFGIGSDGLILIQKHDTSDFEMVFYNPDGSQSLCGNGSRCAVNFAQKLGLLDNYTTFMAYDGLHEAEILDNKEVRLKMSNVQNVSHLADGTFVDTGSPHLMVFTNEVNNCNVVEAGRSIRYSDTFKAKGINVNFVEVKEDNSIFVRTYERGVENETLSCGTGVTASALASTEKGLVSPIRVSTKGGNLSIEFEKNSTSEFTEIYLIGPAKEVFSGTIDID